MRAFSPRPVVALIALAALTQPALAALTPGEQRVVDAAAQVSAEFGEELGAAVQIDSATENLAGIRQLADRFGRQLDELGFESRFAPLPAETHRAGHLVAEHRGSKGKRLLLIGHLDTVYPGANFRREGNKVYGAGVGDMKGGDVVIIEALRALQRADALADTQIIVVMTGDEEAVGEPVAVARQELLDAAKRSDIALAFESAVGNTGTIARRGTAGWELEVDGPSAHSSAIFSENVGNGAVFEAARILNGFLDEVRKIDGVTLNPALVVGGADVTLTRTGGTTAGKSNIIPPRVLVRGDLRFLSAAQKAKAEAAMRAVVAQSMPKTTATLTFRSGYPAMEPTAANRAVLNELDRASRDLGYAAITAYDPRARGAGDVAFVSPPLAGLDGLGLGGQGEHTPKESADISRAPELVKRTALLIYRLSR